MLKMQLRTDKLSLRNVIKGKKQGAEYMLSFV